MLRPLEPGRSSPCVSATTAAGQRALHLLGGLGHGRVAVLPSQQQVDEMAQVDEGGWDASPKTPVVGLRIRPRLGHRCLVDARQGHGQFVHGGVQVLHRAQVEGGHGGAVRSTRRRRVCAV